PSTGHEVRLKLTSESGQIVRTTLFSALDALLFRVLLGSLAGFRLRADVFTIVILLMHRLRTLALLLRDALEGDRPRLIEIGVLNISNRLGRRCRSIEKARTLLLARQIPLKLLSLPGTVLLVRPRRVIIFELVEVVRPDRTRHCEQHQGNKSKESGRGPTRDSADEHTSLLSAITV